MHKCFTEDPSKKFVRAVNAAPEPAVVVTTDRQLQDIARFCTTAFDFALSLWIPHLTWVTLMLLSSPIVTFSYSQSGTRIRQSSLVHAVFTTGRHFQPTSSLHRRLSVSVSS
jgi:hypothetical protein